jgi:hypothetical protein
MIQSSRIVLLLGVFLQLFCSRLILAEAKAASEKNAVIIGASSMNGLPELVEAPSAPAPTNTAPSAAPSGPRPTG